MGILAQARTNDELAVELAKVSGSDTFLGDISRLSRALGEDNGGGSANLPGYVEVG